MTQAELMDLLQSLITQYGDQLRLGGAVVAGVALLVIVVVYFLRKRSAPPAAPAQAPAAKPASPGIRPEPAPEQDFFDSSEFFEELPTEPAAAPARPAVPVSRPAPAASQAATAAGPAIPQDSVLRRHYLAHVRYMIEATTFPRPTDSVLRRHYEQLVGSIFEACLDDAAEMEKLVRRYDEHRREAVKAAA